MKTEQLQAKQESPILSLLFNIALPIFILEKFSSEWGQDGPKLALIAAISIQVGYAVYDYSQRRKISPIFILGFLNVLLTGTLGLLSLDGIWFAVKEASFPLLIGLFVFASSYTRRPFLEILLSNGQVFDLDRLEGELKERGTTEAFHQHLRLSTRLFSLSFLLSAILNFWLAREIFIDIDPGLDDYARQIVLNEQISAMTWRGFLVIMLPSMACFGAVMWHLFSGIKRYSGLKATEVIKQQ